jgi:hypothetical protein
MTQQQKDRWAERAVSTAIIIATALLTGAATWGSVSQRIFYLEREIVDIRPILMRLDRALSVIEQSARDTDRRLDRLER